MVEVLKYWCSISAPKLLLNIISSDNLEIGSHFLYRYINS